MNEWLEEFARRLKEFVADTENDLSVTVRSPRFPNSHELLDRYQGAVSRVHQGDSLQYSALQEVHNELCMAALLLDDPKVREVRYEVDMGTCGKRFDFHVVRLDSSEQFIEVKTIHPKPQDDWEKYQRLISVGRFPQHAHLVLDRQGLGGETFHGFYAARTKMLEHTLDTEEKIRKCLGKGHSQLILLSLFGNGYWHWSHLQDFVHFYYRGNHSPGDVFSEMERHHICEENILFDRSIDHFAYWERSDLHVRPTRSVIPVLPYDYPTV